MAEITKLGMYVFVNKINLTELAKQAGCSREWLCRYTRGAHRISEFLAYKISAAIGGHISAEGLLADNPPMPKRKEKPKPLLSGREKKKRYEAYLKYVPADLRQKKSKQDIPINGAYL